MFKRLLIKTVAHPICFTYSYFVPKARLELATLLRDQIRSLGRSSNYALPGHHFVLTNGLYKMILERYAGNPPASPEWQSGIISFIRIPQIVNIVCFPFICSEQLILKTTSLVRISIMTFPKKQTSARRLTIVLFIKIL